MFNTAVNLNKISLLKRSKQKILNLILILILDHFEQN